MKDHEASSRGPGGPCAPPGPCAPGAPSGGAACASSARSVLVMVRFRRAGSAVRAPGRLSACVVPFSPLLPPGLGRFPAGSGSWCRRVRAGRAQPWPTAYPCGLVTVTHTVVCGLPAACLLYTSDAADDLLCVDLGGRRI